MRIQHLALTALLGLGLAVGCDGANYTEPEVAVDAEEVIDLTEPVEAAPADAAPADVEEDEEQDGSEE